MRDRDFVVLAHVDESCSPALEPGSRVLDGRGQDGVGRGLVEVSHWRIIANPTAVCQFALQSGRLLHVPDAQTLPSWQRRRASPQASPS